jgi:hypothetical protein
LCVVKRTFDWSSWIIFISVLYLFFPASFALALSLCLSAPCLPASLSTPVSLSPCNYTVAVTLAMTTNKNLAISVSGVMA